MRFKTILIILLTSLSLSAGNNSADSVLLAAYQREDMTVWKEYIATFSIEALTGLTTNDLLYEYGYCGYIVAEAKTEGKEALLPEAKACVHQFKTHVEEAHSLSLGEGRGEVLPPGHYEMFLSAVYVYELRLHESMHPVKSMNLAKRATQLAPNDPLVLSYYGTCLFYAPKPFGSKPEALTWFDKAKRLFQDPQWQYCWVREANEMYINKSKDLCR
ncbi:MAG: hypothetical protein IJS82_01700 [Paludibacteraceae bacterium]|nr:hypothetical protein [Paludibacteraceae bacterium]